MSLTATIVAIVVLDVLVVAGLAFVMTRPRLLAPHAHEHEPVLVEIAHRSGPLESRHAHRVRPAASATSHRSRDNK